MISKEKLKKYYIEEGLTDEEIGEELGYCRQTIWKYRQKYNITTKIEVSKKKIEKLYYNQGLSMKNVAEKLGTTAATICRKMREYNLKARKSNKKRTTEDFKKEIYNLVGDEYKVLGEYVNNKKGILMRHYYVDMNGKRTPFLF